MWNINSKYVFEEIYEYIRITSHDKVVNQIVVNKEDGFSGFDRFNLAEINEADNEQYYNDCSLSSLSISFQYSF